MCRIGQIFDNYSPPTKSEGGGEGDILVSVRSSGVGIGIGVTVLYSPCFLNQ